MSNYIQKDVGLITNRTFNPDKENYLERPETNISKQ